MMLRRGLAPSARAAAARSRGAARRPLLPRAAAAQERVPPTFQEKRQLYGRQNGMDQDEKRQGRPENVEGQFYVDHTCIDCQACRWTAPESFSAVGPQAAVTAQPTTREGRVAALQALLSCPVYAIHATHRDAAELKEAQEGLPRPWATAAPGVYHCGWHSDGSFGGASWLIVRPQGGNVLVDSPRFNPVLAKRIEALGGVDWIFLTHKDDVADHAKWAARFPNAKRIIHKGEATARQGTDQCEVQITGDGPWAFPDGGSDLQIIHTPGHTKDHIVLYSAPHKALFSGDHLSGVEDDRAHWKPDGRLFIFDEFNWYDVPEQVRSVQKLLDYDWLFVCPGHGLPAVLPDAAARLREVAKVVERHSGARAGPGGGARAMAASSS